MLNTTGIYSGLQEVTVIVAGLGYMQLQVCPIGSSCTVTYKNQVLGMLPTTGNADSECCCAL